MKTIGMLLILIITACSNTPKSVDNVSKGEAKPTNGASIEAKQLAAEEEAHAVAELKFQKGSSSLSADSKNKLKQLFSSVGEDQKLMNLNSSHGRMKNTHPMNKLNYLKDNEY